ncbi:hypothetical protein HDU98_009236 [Podochytrium sp. JEL0797]|nr:hypothetical protein HDU98_009236 [Podochytrium sp. JEL0797]
MTARVVAPAEAHEFEAEKEVEIKKELLGSTEAWPVFPSWAASQTTYSAPLAYVPNAGYIANISLSDGNTFTMLLDTGSSDIWIRGASCTTGINDTSCGGASQASVNISSPGVKDLDLSYAVPYGTGVSAGEILQATLELAGLKATIAIGVSVVELLDAGYDGLMGLSYEAISDIARTTKYTHVPSNWFDTLRLSNPVFGFYLSNPNDGDDGRVTFGGYDASKFSGPISWFPLLHTAQGVYLSYTFSLDVDPWFWSVAAVAGTPIHGGHGLIATPESDPHGATNMALADTGTNVISLPTTTALKIGAAFGLVYHSDAKVFEIPCVDDANSALFPDLVFHVKGVTFRIPFDIYSVFRGTDENGNNVCVFGVAPGGDKQAIFGAVFSQVAYTIFDKKMNRVGYAQSVHPIK